jgi:hypothetical protein
MKWKKLSEEDRRRKQRKIRDDLKRLREKARMERAMQNEEEAPDAYIPEDFNWHEEN